MRRPPTRTILTGTLLSLALTASAGLPSAHARVDREIRQVNPDPSGLVYVSPFRLEEDVEPGVRRVIRLGLTNDSPDTVDVTITPTDLGPASSPQAVAEKTEDGEFGAGDWIRPEVTDERLQPWEHIELDVVIDPPIDAPVGTNLAGLSVSSSPATGKPGAGDFENPVVVVDALVQVFLTVAGPVEHDLRIVDVDLRDKVVIGNQRFVVWDLTFQNDGTVNEHASGSIDIRSIFGNTAHREPVQSYIVLRGSKRTVRVVWRDLPWVGVFHPEARIRGDDARLVEANGPSVWVLPWWLPVVLVVTIVGPFVAMWWRRRREWRMYLDDDDWVEHDEMDRVDEYQ